MEQFLRMAEPNAKLWFVPIRIHCAPAARIIEAKTSEEAENILKTSELYYKNFNSLPRDKQNKLYEKRCKFLGMIDTFELEDEFYENSGISANNKMTSEEIPECKNRYWHKRWHEYFCKGIDPKETSPPNRYCIINGEHFRFDLPHDCPFLKQESKYIQFTE